MKTVIFGQPPIVGGRPLRRAQTKYFSSNNKGGSCRINFNVIPNIAPGAIDIDDTRRGQRDSMARNRLWLCPSPSEMRKTAPLRWKTPCDPVQSHQGPKKKNQQ